MKVNQHKISEEKVNLPEGITTILPKIRKNVLQNFYQDGQVFFQRMQKILVNATRLTIK